MIRYKRTNLTIFLQLSAVTLNYILEDGSINTSGTGKALPTHSMDMFPK